MRFSLPQHLYVGFGLPLIALGLVGWFSYQSTIQSVETSTRREQTFAVLDELNAALALLKDAETSQRGYLITGNDRYLAPYRAAVEEIGPTLQRVRGSLTEDDQRRRLAALELLTTDKLDELKETIELRRAHGFEAAQQVVLTDRGQAAMQAIRQTVGEMKDAERERLQSLTIVSLASARRILWLVPAGTLVGAVFGVVAFLLVLHEIARRSRAEQALRTSEEAVRALNDGLESHIEERTAELAETNRQLLERNRENETFVYTVSHDLRSPLVNLQGFAQELSLTCQDVRRLLTANELPPDVERRGLSLIDVDMAESVRFIQTAVIRLSHIIDALLRLSQAGRVEYQNQQVGVQKIVESIVTALAATIAERQASVTIGVLPFVWGDPTALEQLFANLIGNALNYLDPDRAGQVEIGAMPPTESAGTDRERIYFVRDNGLGVPEAYRPKLFRAFQRLHPDRAPGEGLGLAIVHRVVERHHGRIWIESTVGGGATFFVALPSSPPTARRDMKTGRPTDWAVRSGTPKT